MTPTQALALLDRQMTAHGTTVTLRRLGSPNVDVSIRAMVRQATQVELGEDMLRHQVIQYDREVIMSPSGLGTWPGALAQSDGTDVKVPRRGDVVIINGRTHSVQEADPRYIAGTLVRINLVVRG